MADTLIQVPPDSTGKMVRAFSGTVGANTVYEEAFVLCDSNMNIIGSLNSSPAGTEYGLVTRPIPPTLTKGTQGTTGISTQDLKDSGRTYVVITLDRVAGVTTEALTTMSMNKGGTVTSGTSYTVTAGKTLRLQAITAGVLDTSTTLAYGRIRVRSAAAVSATSGIVIAMDIGNLTGTAAAGVGEGEEWSIPDGLEIAGGQQIGISQLVNTTSSSISVCLIGYEY